MDDNQNSNKNNLASTNPLANPAPGSKLDDAFNMNSIPAPSSETPSDNLGQNITPTQSSPWPVPQTPLEPVNPVAAQLNPIPTFTATGDTNQQQLSENLAAVLQTSSPPEAQSAVLHSPTPPIEPAPTDLSQLTGNNHQPPPDIYTPPVSNNENFIVPTTTVPESINTSHSFFPVLKILLIGLVLLVLTGAASAYFIFGIRIPQFQTPSPKPSSINQTSPTPEPTQTPQPSPTNTLGGSNPQPISTSSSKPKSALETLKERQGSRSATR